MSTTLSTGFASVAARIGAEVAAAAADDVDAQARFPHEAIEAIKEAGILGAMIPADLGGAGAKIPEMARAVEEMGRHCSSTGLILAMHLSQVACLVRHGSTAAMTGLMREVTSRQMLLASATTEVGIGGDVRSSSCAVELDGSRFRLRKQAPVISYGADADAVFVTARRHPDSPPNDQVLVVCTGPGLKLSPVGGWDTLGFRGTCSLGFVLEAEGSSEMILPEPYEAISSRTMLPAAHVFWSSCWLGMATEAVDRARKYVQGEARKKPGTLPPSAKRLAELYAALQQMRDLVRGAARRFDEADIDGDEIAGIGFAIAMNSLKVSASSLLIDIVGKAMAICGMAGYRLDSPSSLGRLLRDAHGSALMVNNDRIIANNAQLLMVHRGE